MCLQDSSTPTHPTHYLLPLSTNIPFEIIPQSIGQYVPIGTADDDEMMVMVGVGVMSVKQVDSVMIDSTTCSHPCHAGSTVKTD